MSKLSEIEARDYDGRLTWQAVEDRRYLLGLVREMRETLENVANTESNGYINARARALLARMEE